MQTNKDDHTFPISDLSEFGLTIRQHFAVSALQGLCATDMTIQESVETAVMMADALIAELNKTEK